MATTTTWWFGIDGESKFWAYLQLWTCPFLHLLLKFYHIHPVMLELTADHMGFIMHEGYGATPMVRVGVMPSRLETRWLSLSMSCIGEACTLHLLDPVHWRMIFQGVIAASNYISFQGSDVLMIGLVPYKYQLSMVGPYNTFESPRRQYGANGVVVKRKRMPRMVYLCGWVACPLRVAQRLIVWWEPRHQPGEHRHQSWVFKCSYLLLGYGYLLLGYGWRSTKINT